jgi:hypothetical protein
LPIASTAARRTPASGSESAATKLVESSLRVLERKRLQASAASSPVAGMRHMPRRCGRTNSALLYSHHSHQPSSSSSASEGVLGRPPLEPEPVPVPLGAPAAEPGVPVRAVPCEPAVEGALGVVGPEGVSTGCSRGTPPFSISPIGPPPQPWPPPLLPPWPTSCGGAWMRAASLKLRPLRPSQARKLGSRARSAIQAWFDPPRDRADELVRAAGVHQLGHRATPRAGVDEVGHARAGVVAVDAEDAALAVQRQHVQQALALRALRRRQRARVLGAQLGLGGGVVGAQAGDAFGPAKVFAWGAGGSWAGTSSGASRTGMKSFMAGPLLRAGAGLARRMPSLFASAAREGTSGGVPRA